MIIAILGAESTGKTQLAQALVQSHPHHAHWAPEYLRQWCSEQGRTPQPHEQKAIAQEQARRITSHTQANHPENGVIIADTTALMTAIYSDVLFNDASLYPFALSQHSHVDLTLVTGLDLPWVADGLQRDGLHMQAQVDARLRHVLTTHALDYTVVYGVGQARAECALRAITQAAARAHPKPVEPVSQARPVWQWNCETCSDPVCEHTLFSTLIKSQSQGSY
jgi:HTH-type transcriptional repressor of NAD biosynthesis genes